MSQSPLSIAYPAVGAFMSDEVALFTPGTRESGVSFINMCSGIEIRERKLRTRSRWRELALESAPDDWATANTQCVIAYDPRIGRTPLDVTTGSPGMVESAAGKLFRITPGDRTFKVEDISQGIRGRQSMRLAWMTQARNFVIRTDEASLTQIWTGTITDTSPGYNKDAPAASRLPNFAGPLCFTEMVWITNNRTEVIAGDYVNQTDLIGNSDIPKTTTQSYDFTSTSFKAPLEMGDITSMFVVTSYRGGGLPVQAEIVVGTQGQGIWGIMGGIKRDQWGATPMRRIIHQTVAPTGPFAGWASNDELIFRTNQGVSSIKYLMQETSNLGNPLVNIAQEIRPLLDRDPQDLLLFASLYVSARKQRLVLTTWPVVDGYNRFHRGYVSMALAPGRTRVPEAGIWEGVQTLPEAMGNVIQFIEVRDLDRIRSFALTQKSDGTKGLCEWTSDRGDDILADGTPVRIPWQVHTRKLCTSGEMSPSNWGAGFLSINDIHDYVTVRILARSKSSRPFQLLGEYTLKNPKWGEELAGPADIEPLCLGTMFQQFRDPWLEILIQGEGTCGGIDLAILSTGPGNPASNASPKEVCLESEHLCAVDYFQRN